MNKIQLIIRKTTVYFLALTTVSTFIGCSTSVTDGEADLSETMIAFVVYGDDGPGIWTMSPDGTDKKMLTAGNSPCWSPDGSKIAFSARVDGNSDIYIINPDGSDINRLTSHEARDGGPTWSPDGSMIAFQSNRSGSSQIWRTNVDSGAWGYNLTQLTEDTPHRRVNNFISWSPDGLWIAFEADRDRDDPEIYLANAVDGTNQQRLTFTRALDEVPSWSPDSKQIVFSSDMHGEPQSGNYDIYIMNIDGSGQKRLTVTEGQASNPTMSPDGSKIVYDFSGGRGETGNIYIMNADGNDIKLITEGGNPAWSPLR